LEQAGLVAQVVGPLEKAGVSVGIFRGVTPEPPIEVIRMAVAAAREFGPDAVVGLGGGSNMDAAKLVAIVLAHGGDATQYVGDCVVPGPVTPLVCIPTTSGTGSEVSAAAVFTDTAKQMKVSCLSPHLRPRVALVDPALTDGCPRQVTADSGIDALTHAIEAFTAVDMSEFETRPPGGLTVYQGKNPFADSAAKTTFEHVAKFLTRAVKNGADKDARDGMALAATFGGLAFANAGVAMVHAMEYPVGGTVHVSHGAGNGLLLPFVMRYNATVRANEIAALGPYFGVPATVGAAIAAVEALRAEIGIPTRLRDLGVTESMLPAFAERAFGIKRLMRVNPRMPQNMDEILKIYQDAF
jgi:alcohol dehydrogenase class IV